MRFISSGMLRLIAVSVICLSVIPGINAAEPSGYYKTCLNLKDEALIKALNELVGPHNDVGYSGLWELYGKSDVRDNGTIWDIYSDIEWTFKKDQCGSYTVFGECYNREHSFPKSWFNDKAPMYSDAFHIYPTDGKVNGQRASYPYGECANGTSVASNGKNKPLGKLGSSTYPGYTGIVFEPDDMYKGDIARSYFYMATAYHDQIAGFSSPILDGNAFPAYKQWFIEMLLKWHRQDPVSEKEIKRNEAIYAAQNNRNPFIDHPELAEFLWGDKKGERWQGQAEAKPIVNYPANGSTVELGACAVGLPRQFDLNIKASCLTQNLRLSVSGAFTVSPSVLTLDDVCDDNGDVVTVTVTAPAAGVNTGLLTMTSGDLTSTVTLSATAYEGIPLEAPAAVTDCSFEVRWVNVGDHLDGGKYTLDVATAGKSVDGYPRSVDAAAQTYTVDGLTPSTTYIYRLSSAKMRSVDATVTTAAPIPSITFYFEGEPYIVAQPGEPSAPFEVNFDAENISGNITFSVSAPFELSASGTQWSNTLVLSADEERLFIRVNSAEKGMFETFLVAQAGDNRFDDLLFAANVGDDHGFVEDFDNPQPEDNKLDSYDGNKTYFGKHANWQLVNAGMWGTEGIDQTKAIRFGKTATSSIAMITDKSHGVATVTAYMAAWSASEKAEVELMVSDDNGATWTSAGKAAVDVAEYRPYTFTVNKPGDIRLKIQQTAGARMLVDNIEAGDYSSAGVTDSEFASWQAYGHNGMLTIITADTSADIYVYALDGLTVYSAPGRSDATFTVSLTSGIYIVAVGNASRRVMVK